MTTTPPPRPTDEPETPGGQEPAVKAAAAVPATAEATVAGAAVTAVFRRALRDVLLFLAALTAVGVATGWLVSGSTGVWGALLGAAVAVFFSGTTIVVMLRTARSSPATTAAIVMGSWLVKMVVLVAILAVLRDMEFYDRWVLGAVLLVGVIGSALLDYRAASSGRIPYVEPNRP